MAASSSDKFQLVGNPGSATTLAAPGHTIAGTSFTVVSTSNWPTTTGVTFAVDTYDPSTGLRVPGSYTEWSGVVASSTSITGAVLRYGTDQNYSAGSTTRVYIPVASQWVAQLVAGLLVEHNQDGTHGALTATSVAATGAVSGATGTFTGNVSDRSTTLTQYRVDSTFDYVVSGGVWTADSAGVNRNASMTAIVVWINGQRGTISAVTARSFTASKDTYIDVLNTAGVFTLVYTEVANNAASPALAANSIRIGIIVTAAGSIAAASSINQGQEDRVLPIASSVPYAVTDSLGNLICPRDPNRKILGYRQVTSNTAVATGAATVVISAPVIVPTGRKVTIRVGSGGITNNSVANTNTYIDDGTTNLAQGGFTAAGASYLGNGGIEGFQTPAASSKTYRFLGNTSAGTGTITGNATSPAWIKVELV